MREKTFDEYLSEMMKMYKVSSAVPVVAENEAAEYNGKGSIIVVVNGGNNAIPLKNATVTIMDTEGNVINEMQTDESGKTAFIELPAPLLSETLTPNATGRRVFAYYDIMASKENYITDTKKNVPVFDSTVSIQEFNLVWIPASNGENTPTTENEGNPYTL